MRASLPIRGDTSAKLRHSGESRNPEGLGKRRSDYQCVDLKRCRGILQGALRGGRLRLAGENGAAHNFGGVAGHEDGDLGDVVGIGKSGDLGVILSLIARDLEVSTQILEH